MDCKSAGSCVMRRRGRYGINAPITKRVANVKIVSGGQTGVDRGALEAAVALGLDFGGWAPHGWIQKAGRFRGV